MNRNNETIMIIAIVAAIETLWRLKPFFCFPVELDHGKSKSNKNEITAGMKRKSAQSRRAHIGMMKVPDYIGTSAKSEPCPQVPLGYRNRRISMNEAKNADMMATFKYEGSA